MRGPNILLIVLDSVRASNCGVYGHDNRTTPFLSSFVSGATTFEQARSPSIHSVASHASIFSGYHTEEHGVTEYGSHLDPRVNIWNELKQEHGYETGIFTPNVVVTESSNLSDCFQTEVGPLRESSPTLFKNASSPANVSNSTTPLEYAMWSLTRDKPVRTGLNGIYHKLLTRNLRAHDTANESAEYYVNELIGWVEERTTRWAACVNLMDAHYPYVPRPEHNIWGGERLARLERELSQNQLHESFLSGTPWGQLRALESLYDGCIHQLDAQLSRLMSFLEEAGALADTLVVMTSDHGEGFGERSSVDSSVRLATHNWGIDEVLTHVPLIVKTPGQSQSELVQEPSTLTRFPSVVRATIQGMPDPQARFVPDGPVVSSTYRARPPAESLPVSEVDRQKYFGPWQAVYTTEDELVYKHARRGDDTVSLRIVDAQTAFEVEHSSELLDRTFDAMEPADVAEGSPQEPISDDVSNRLEELGYLT